MENAGLIDDGINPLKSMMEKMKNNIFEKMDENSKRQTQTLTELTNKNNEQDLRIDSIEASNNDLKKKIEVVEINGKKTFADMAAKAPQDGNNSKETPDKVPNQQSKKNDKSSIQNVLLLANHIIGLQPIDSDDITHNTWEGDTEEDGVRNAVREFLMDKLKFSETEVDELGISNIKKSKKIDSSQRYSSSFRYI